MAESGEIELMPEPSILIESLRDIGYSFQSAVADIVDNSITARATRIDIKVFPSIDGFAVSIKDDGTGLTKDELLQAMRLGSRNPREMRENNDLGRFGLGLKTASFSQCRRLTVVSRCNGETSAYTWDLDVVAAHNKWAVIQRDDLNNIPGVEDLGLQGTLVLWEKVDRLVGRNSSGNNNGSRVISELQDHLSLVFHRFLEGSHKANRIIISVNYKALEPLDPFNSNHPATVPVSSEEILPGVQLQAFTLPHENMYESKREYERFALPGGYLRNQGIYLYRANRLIIFGTWFGLTKKTALTQLSRVRIDIGTDQDERWKIDVKKVSAQLPEEVRERIKRLLNTIIAPSKRVYRRRGAKLTDTERNSVWQRLREGEKTVYGLNMEHPLFQQFKDQLDDGHKKQFDALLALIGSVLPTDALFYDIEHDVNSVATAPIANSDLATLVHQFLDEVGRDVNQNDVIDMMRDIEPFQSRWDETEKILEKEWIRE